MSKSLKILSILFVIIAIILLIVPQFISVEKQRQEIEQQIINATGYEVSSDSEIKLSFLPMPRILMQNLKIKHGNIEVVNSQIMEVRLNLIDLLLGKLTAKSLIFDFAKVDVDLIDSRINQSDIGFLNNLQFTNSQFTFHNHEDVRYRLRKADASFNFNHATNAYFLEITDHSNEEEVTLSAHLVAGTNEAKFHLFSKSFDFQYEGNFLIEDPQDLATIQSDGMLSAQISDLSNSLKGYLANNSQVKGNNDDLIQFNTKMSFENMRMTMSNINFDSEIMKGQGKVIADFKVKNVVDFNLNLKHLNLSKFINKNDNLFAYLRLPKYLDALIYVSAEEIYFDHKMSKNFKFNASLANQNLDIYEVSSSFDGGLDFKFKGLVKDDGIRSILEGKIIGNGNDLYESLKSFNLHHDYMKDITWQYQLQSDLLLSENEIRFGNYHVYANGIEVVGDLQRVFSKDSNSDEVFISSSFNKIDLDDFNFSNMFDEIMGFFLPKSQANINENSLKLRNINEKINVDLNFGQIKFGDEIYKNIFVALDVKPSHVIVRKFNISSNDNEFSAYANLDSRALKPKLKLVIGGNKVNYEILDKIKNHVVRKADEKLQRGYLWSVAKFNTPSYPNIEVGFDFKLREMIMRDYVINDFQFSGEIDYDIMNIKKLSGKIFNGNLKSEGSYNFDSNSLNISLGYNNIHAEELLQNTIGLDNIKGYLSTSGTISTYGSTFYEWIINMNANLSFAGRAIEVDGLNLQQILDVSFGNDKINKSEFDEILKLGVWNGMTKFDNVDFITKINHSNVEFKSFKFNNDRFSGAIAGTADLAKLYSNLAGKISFIPMKKERPVILDLKLKGGLNAMEKSFQSPDLIRFMMRKERLF